MDVIVWNVWRVKVSKANRCAAEQKENAFLWRETGHRCHDMADQIAKGSVHAHGGRDVIVCILALG